MRALFDDEAAGHDFPARMFRQARDRAIRIPCNVLVEFQRMAADGEIEIVGFPLEPLAAGRLLKEGRRRNAEC